MKLAILEFFYCGEFVKNLNACLYQNSLHAGDKSKQGINPGLETQNQTSPRSPKQGYQWSHEKDLGPSSFFKVLFFISQCTEIV